MIVVENLCVIPVENLLHSEVILSLNVLRRCDLSEPSITRASENYNTLGNIL